MVSTRMRFLVLSLVLVLCLSTAVQNAEALKLKSRLKSVIRDFVENFDDIGDSSRVLLKDYRVRYVIIFDLVMLLMFTAVTLFASEGFFKEFGLIASGYFAIFATVLAFPIVSMDYPQAVDPDVADVAGKLAILIIALLTVAMGGYLVLRILQESKKESAQAAQTQYEKMTKIFSNQLVVDVLSCKDSLASLTKLVNDEDSLGKRTPEEVGKAIGPAIRSLVSFMKLANLTIFSSEAPIQVLYEKHFMDKEVALAFHTMDDQHKNILATTAAVLEEYFLRNEKKNENETRKDK